jgi:hypothetical protein
VARIARHPCPVGRSAPGLKMDKEAAARLAKDRSSASKQVVKAAKDWRAAKKRERAARDALAQIVVAAVKAGLLTENKISNLTDIPRMTIRKMLGKDGNGRRAEE